MKYSVPFSWYQGLYKDKADVRESGRSFTYSSGFFASALLVHGYAGYPGELVSIARMLYSSGLDVYVPRLPGMGTSGEDFKNSGLNDWLGLVDNAITELKLNNGIVYGFGHSMGATLLALADNKRLDKAVMAAPAIRFKNPIDKEELRRLKDEDKILDVPWHSDSRYHLHYDGAPKDDEYYGREYWSKLYPSQMLDLCRAMELSEKLFLKNPRYLIAYGSEDELCSYPESLTSSFTHKLKIEGGSHYLVYDKSEKAEMELLIATNEFLKVM